MNAERQLLDTIDALTPKALHVVLVHAANELWAAVDEGHADVALLTQAAEHLRMLVELGPRMRTQ